VRRAFALGASRTTSRKISKGPMLRRMAPRRAALGSRPERLASIASSSQIVSAIFIRVRMPAGQVPAKTPSLIVTADAIISALGQLWTSSGLDKAQE
jgi:hypothetical protein